MSIKIIECPRDAMQGFKNWVPTELKIAYLNQLLKVGFDTIDFGSFVSPKAIPQMKDTAEVLMSLDVEGTTSKLLAIVVNERGALDAAQFKAIQYLGFPLSISETFQIRNTKQTLAEALKMATSIKSICDLHQKEMVVYLSMGFGNPYGDPYNTKIVNAFTQQLDQLNVSIIALSDTIGAGNPDLIYEVFSALIPQFPHIEFGAHLHARPDSALKKINAAYEAGCRRFDTAIRGFGGCPMADDELTGNLATETLLNFLNSRKIAHSINDHYFNAAVTFSNQVFAK